MSIKASEIDQAWRKLGMEITRTGDLHAIFRHEGKFILRTKRSFGSRKLDGNIPHLIRQQLKLNAREFSDLLDCPLDRRKYIEILISKGVIQKPVRPAPAGGQTSR